MYQNIIHIQEIDSTNSELRRRLASNSLPNGTAIFADFQTAGRGRLQRTWQSPPGANLLVSYWLELDMSPAELCGFSLIPSLAVLDALDIRGVHAACKWPNDIRHDGRKLAGILTECQDAAHGKIHGAIVGIGLNVQSAPGTDIPGAQPVSLFELTGKTFSRLALCSDLQRALLTRTSAWRNGLRASLFAEWLSRCDHLHQQVTVTVDGRKQQGLMRGLGRQGQLLLELNGQSREIWVDDLHTL